MTDKITKAEAEYVGNSTKQFCHDCSMFRSASAHCTLVKGIINPNGHCKYWEARLKKMVDYSDIDKD